MPRLLAILVTKLFEPGQADTASLRWDTGSLAPPGHGVFEIYAVLTADVIITAVDTTRYLGYFRPVDSLPGFLCHFLNQSLFSKLGSSAVTITR